LINRLTDEALDYSRELSHRASRSISRRRNMRKHTRVLDDNGRDNDWKNFERQAAIAASVKVINNVGSRYL
jgi:hypothetical protein